jgi:hypothetical protein
MARRRESGQSVRVHDDAQWQQRGEQKFADAARNAAAVAQTLVGLREDEAAERVQEAGYAVRIVERDGEIVPLSRDRRPSRINIRVTGGKVTSADVY